MTQERRETDQSSEVSNSNESGAEAPSTAERDEFARVQRASSAARRDQIYSKTATPLLGMPELIGENGEVLVTAKKPISDNFGEATKPENLFKAVLSELHRVAGQKDFNLPPEMRKLVDSIHQGYSPESGITISAADLKSLSSEFEKAVKTGRLKVSTEELKHILDLFRKAPIEGVHLDADQAKQFFDVFKPTVAIEAERKELSEWLSKHFSDFDNAADRAKQKTDDIDEVIGRFSDGRFGQQDIEAKLREGKWEDGRPFSEYDRVMFERLRKLQYELSRGGSEEDYIDRYDLDKFAHKGKTEIKDGVTRTTLDDGRVFTTYNDVGAVRTDYPDGSVVFELKNPAYSEVRTIITLRADGTGSLSDGRDGELLQLKKKSDGTWIGRDASGNQIVFRYDQKAGLVAVDSDALKIDADADHYNVETGDGQRSRARVNPDGSVTIEFEDGTTITRKPDGTVDVQEPSAGA